MVKKAAILLSKFSTSTFPVEWNTTDWSEIVRAGKGYKVILSFDRYFTPAIVAQFDFIGTPEQFEQWILEDPEKLYEEDIEFGKQMIKEYQLHNRSLNLSTQDSLTQLQKFQSIASLLDRGSIKASAALLSGVAVDSIFTQERKDYFIQRFNEYLGL